MATELARAFVQIVPTAKGIKGQLTNLLGGEASSAGNTAGESMGGALLGKLKGLIAAAGIGKMLADTINEGAALQQSIGGIETLFKESSDKVLGYANEAYKTAGLSANAYMESVTGFSASLLQGLGGDTEKAAEVANRALVDMSDNANKMGSDMQSIQTAYQGFAKQNYTMLDNLKLGYGGTKTEMERLLKKANEINAQQGIYTDYSIENFADIVDAIHVVQEEMGITGATAYEAATTISGSAASMKAAFHNVLGNLALGEDIKPALRSLVETTGVFLFDNLLPAVGNVLTGLPTVFGEIIAEGIPNIMAHGSTLVTSLINGIIEFVPNAVETIKSLATNMITAIAENSGTWIAKGKEFISNMSEGIKNNAPAAIAALGDIIANLVGKLLDSLPGFLEKGIEIIEFVATGIGNCLPTILSSMGKVIVETIAKIAEHLPEFLEKGIEIIGKVAAGFLNAIPNVLQACADIIGNIKDAFTNIDWGSIGRSIIDGISNGIRNAASTIKEAAMNAARSALDAAKNFLGIHSPSRVFRDQVGKMIAEGWAEGVVSGKEDVADAVDTLGELSTSMIDVDLSADIKGKNGYGESLLAILMQMLEMLGIMADIEREGTGTAKINYREVRRLLEEMGVVFA